MCFSVPQPQKENPIKFIRFSLIPTLCNQAFKHPIKIIIHGGEFR